MRRKPSARHLPAGVNCCQTGECLVEHLLMARAGRSTRPAHFSEDSVSLARIQQHQREALNYRIQRGTMSIKLLSVKTGLSQSHLCLFLHGRKRLSLDAMDKVLAAQGLAVEVLPIQKT